VFTIEDIITIAVQIERNGEQLYRLAAKRLSKPELSAMLDWMADEEAQHAQWLEALDTSPLPGTEVRDNQLESMGQNILKEMLGDLSFSLDVRNYSDRDHIDQLIDRSVEFENDTIIFYELLGSFIRDKHTRDCLDVIVAEENRHIQRLKSMRTLAE
jgi:rubrerythrin